VIILRPDADGRHVDRPDIAEKLLIRRPKVIKTLLAAAVNMQKKKNERYERS